MTQTISLRGPHTTRPVRYLGEHTRRGWRLKVYGIAACAELPRADLIAAAKDLADRELPRPAVVAESPARYGVGFVVVHDGADFGFVLLDWWAGEHEIHQKLFSCPLGQPDSLDSHHTPAIGCVWELAVIDHERRAWMRHVLANPAGPNLEAYFDDRARQDI